MRTARVSVLFMNDTYLSLFCPIDLYLLGFYHIEISLNPILVVMCRAEA